MNNAELDKLKEELQQCARGQRGWVSLQKARAKKIGVEHAAILEIANEMGLKTRQHGRMGWSATRA